MQTSELIERLEKATGACRELDAAIAQVVSAEHGPREKVYYESRTVEYFDEVAPRYTASIDAALTLVPEGWTYVSLEICARGLSTQHCRASVERLVGEHDDEREHGYAPTPALAIVIAALRASNEGEGA